MELVERLANTGHVALAQRRLSSAVPLLPKDDASKSRRAYAALLEIWIAVVDRNTKAAEKLLAEAREQYGQTIENDASSMTLVLVSEARLAFLKNTTATDKARLEGIFEKTFKIVNEALAKTDADERQVLETMLVFWRASVDIYGPMSAEALSYIQQIAHRQVPPMVARELVDEWLALGPRIDSKLKAGDGGKADQLLFIRNFMDLSGDHVEALALGEIGLRYLDNTSADQIGLRAKYRIEIARDLIRTGEAARAVPLLREALEFRSQYFEQYKGADPAEKMRRLHQVAIAENELGFALQNNRAYEESTTHLKSATKILHENSIQDPDGVSAALQNLAVNCLALGNFEGARVVAAEALRIRELIEDKTGANDSRLSLAFALHYLKREAEARLLFDDWLREYEWTNDLTVDAQELYAVIDGKEVSLSTVVKLPDMKFPELTRLKTALKENSKKVRGQVKSEVGEGT
jgi:tetratricopeptide (TPR) repeat protein